MAGVPVVSSWIQSIERDDEKSKLDVNLDSGESYTDVNVPQSVYQAFLNAPSPGRFLSLRSRIDLLKRRIDFWQKVLTEGFISGDKLRLVKNLRLAGFLIVAALAFGTAFAQDQDQKRIAKAIEQNQLHALKSLDNITVFPYLDVASNLSDDTMVMKLEDLVSLVETKLRSSRVPLMTEEQFSQSVMDFAGKKRKKIPSKADLLISVGLMGGPIKGTCVWVIESNLTVEGKALYDTSVIAPLYLWEAGTSYGSIGINGLDAAIRETVEEKLDKFCNLWLKAHGN